MISKPSNKKVMNLKPGFKDFIKERQERKILVPDEVKRMINPSIQKTEIPVYDETFDYYKYVENLRKLEADLRGSESQIEDGVVKDSNFYVFPFRTLITIPGSSTQHTIPYKLSDLKNKLDDFGIRMFYRLLEDIDFKDIPIKVKRRSRSGFIMTNKTTYLDINNLKYFDNPFVKETGFRYIIDNVYNIDDKMHLMNAMSGHREDYQPLYSFSFRKDTPDKVGEDYNAKIRTYMDLEGKQFDVDPNTEFGTLVRTRTVTAGSLSDNLFLLRVSSALIKHCQKYHPWQQGKLAEALHRAKAVINLDVKNFDLSGTQIYRDMLVEVLGLQEYYEEFKKFKLLAWNYSNSNMNAVQYKLMNLTDLGNGTISGHQLFTTNLNWVIPMVDVSAALHNVLGWDEDRVYKWFVDPSNEGFELSSCGDDNSFIVHDISKLTDVKNVVQWLLNSGSINWVEEFGSTLGLLMNESGDVSNDISKNFVKSLYTPYNFFSKIKPYRAFGFKLKYSMPAYRTLLDKLFAFYPEMKNIIENTHEPELEAKGLTLYDLEHGEWDSRSKLYDVLYADVSTVEIKGMR